MFWPEWAKQMLAISVSDASGPGREIPVTRLWAGKWTRGDRPQRNSNYLMIVILVSVFELNDPARR